MTHDRLVRGVAPRRVSPALTEDIATRPPSVRPTGATKMGPDAILQLQAVVGNAAVGVVVQRSIPTDRELHQMCLDGSVFTALTDAELVETIAAIDRLLPGLTDDADRLTAEQNRQQARRQQAQRRHPGFEALATGVRGAVGAPARRTAVEALVTWSRQQLDGYPDLIRRYRQQSVPDAAEKVRVLGRAAAAVARMEYLLGTTLHRGGSWEATANQGPMVDDYGGGSAWCSRFATNALQEIYGPGMRAGSGYKIANPDEFADVELNYDAAQGGAFVGTERSQHATAANNPFVGLRESLQAIANGTDTQQTADQVANQFMTDRIRPQPGDLLIVRRGAADPNSFAPESLSHTLMVESVSGTRISLIEGNAGTATDRVTGRVLDLSVVGDVEEIVFISRPSLTSGLNAADAATVGTVDTPEADRITSDQIQAPIDDLNLLLEQLARSEGDVSHGPVGGSVAELSGNP
jgi:hypothetical protein